MCADGFCELSDDDIFIANAHVIMKELLKSRKIPLNSSEQIAKISENIKTSVKTIRQEGELSEYLRQIDSVIMNEIQSNLHSVEILDFKDIKFRIVINFIPKSSNKTAEFINSIIVSDLEKVLQSGEYSVLFKYKI